MANDSVGVAEVSTAALPARWRRTLAGSLGWRKRSVLAVAQGDRPGGVL